MKCIEKIRKYQLHDSMVIMINNDIDKKTIEFEIELCNWMQENYSKDEPEFIVGKIIFSGTSNYYHEPDILEFDYDEILTIDAIADNPESGVTIKIVLRGNDVKVITFNAKDVAFEFKIDRNSQQN